MHLAVSCVSNGARNTDDAMDVIVRGIQPVRGVVSAGRPPTCSPSPENRAVVVNCHTTLVSHRRAGHILGEPKLDYCRCSRMGLLDHLDLAAAAAAVRRLVAADVEVKRGVRESFGSKDLVVVKRALCLSCLTGLIEGACLCIRIGGL